MTFKMWQRSRFLSAHLDDLQLQHTGVTGTQRPPGGPAPRQLHRPPGGAVSAASNQNLQDLICLNNETMKTALQRPER